MSAIFALFPPSLPPSLPPFFPSLLPPSLPPFLISLTHPPPSSLCLTPAQAGSTAASNLLDPFSRRWTRSQNYYKAKGGAVTTKEGKNDARVGDDEEAAAKTSDKGVKDGDVAVLQATQDGAKGRSAQRRAAIEKILRNRLLPLDPRTSKMLARHDIDLQVDLSVVDQWEKPGAGGWEGTFMHRRQQQDRAIGPPVGVVGGNGGTRSVISLEEYKRRRGMV